MMRRKYDNESRDRKGSSVGWFLGIIGIAILVFVFLAVGRNSWTNDRYYLMAVVGAEKISIMGVNANEGRGYELILPGNMLVPVVGMEGDLKANSIWKFGVDEGEPESIVQHSLERLLGVKINGVIRSDKVTWAAVWGGRSGPLVERIKWFRSWHDLRDDQKDIQGVPSNITEFKRYPDGEEVIEVNEMALKNLISDFWANSLLLDERIGIEVVNASGEEGMGKLAETMIKAAGGLVLRVEAEQSREGTCWYAAKDDFLNSKTIEWLAKQFDCQQDKHAEVDASIKLWLGREWGDRYRRS